MKTKTPVAGRPASEVVTPRMTPPRSLDPGVSRLATRGGNGSGHDPVQILIIAATSSCKQQTISTTTLANLASSYDLADRITQITYPSGRLVGYVRDTKDPGDDGPDQGDCGHSVLGTSVASSIQYSEALAA
ncbi:MAG: hypothetical protein IPO97_11050 [Sphingomonadales bacterium]|nr:hypothetical protein [Sphingomonadales bacterium]